MRLGYEQSREEAMKSVVFTFEVGCGSSGCVVVFVVGCECYCWSFLLRKLFEVGEVIGSSSVLKGLMLENS